MKFRQEIGFKKFGTELRKVVGLDQILAGNVVTCFSWNRYTLQKQVGYFNHRVITLVAVKLERRWLREVCFGIEV